MAARYEEEANIIPFAEAISIVQESSTNLGSAVTVFNDSTATLEAARSAIYDQRQALQTALSQIARTRISLAAERLGISEEEATSRFGGYGGEAALDEVGIPKPELPTQTSDLVAATSPENIILGNPIPYPLPKLS